MKKDLARKMGSNDWHRPSTNRTEANAFAGMGQLGQNTWACNQPVEIVGDMLLVSQRFQLHPELGLWCDHVQCVFTAQGIWCAVAVSKSRDASARTTSLPACAPAFSEQWRWCTWALAQSAWHLPVPAPTGSLKTLTRQQNEVGAENACGSLLSCYLRPQSLRATSL